MKIELNENQLDEVTKETIKSLEKRVKSLETKLRNRDRTIQDLRKGIDISKERRATIQQLAQNLVAELQNAGWTDYDDIY